MLKNLLKFFVRNTLNNILSFLDAVLPPLPTLVLKSAAPEPEPEPVPALKPETKPVPVPAPEQNMSYIGIYPVGSHAAMYMQRPITPEHPAALTVVPEPSITELVIHLPPAPNDALVAIQASLTQVIADVLTCAPGRVAIVEALLDEAWQQGLRTYAQLIKYVELQTGKGCSKKTVSAWKKSRQLDRVDIAA